MKTKSLFKQLSAIFLLIFSLCLLSSAKRSPRNSNKLHPLKLTSVHIVDRNGFAETIGNKERLKQFQNVNFLSSQPYQKILRIYARDSKGNIRSVVNTYHENGNPKQFLEILNARANGYYCEWHENGAMSVMTKVIGGQPDVTGAAERSWIFDGVSYAWNPEGELIAEMNYSQGSLEGDLIQYHPSGEVWKQMPYINNQLEGMVQIFKNQGELLESASYEKGEKHGQTLRYWSPKSLASQEKYSRGKLEDGEYFDPQGLLIAEVKKGSGNRAIFGKKHIYELQEYQEGRLEGEVKVFNSEGLIKRVYHVKNGIKHGEEIEYQDRLFDPSPPKPKLSFYWYEGKIQGNTKTWYQNGRLESQKEMANNLKNGMLTAWYRDGSLMMIEEYEHDQLKRGEYFKKEERIPVSQVVDGKGIVTIFDADGHFIQKINYSGGKPEI